MTDQPALFADPVWTDTFAIGDRVRAAHPNAPVGTIVAIDPGTSVTVRVEDHPRQGTFETRWHSWWGLRFADESEAP